MEETRIRPPRRHLLPDKGSGNRPPSRGRPDPIAPGSPPEAEYGESPSPDLATEERGPPLTRRSSLPAAGRRPLPSPEEEVASWRRTPLPVTITGGGGRVVEEVTATRAVEEAAATSAGEEVCRAA